MLADLHCLCDTLPAGEVEVFLSNRFVNLRLSWTPEAEDSGATVQRPEAGIVFRLDGRSDRANYREVVEPAAVPAEETEVKEKTEVSFEAVDNQVVNEVDDVTGESSRERKDAVEPVKEMPMSVKALADSAKDTAELVKAQWNPLQKMLTSGRHTATLRDYSPWVFRRLLMQWGHRLHTKKREWLMDTDETREFSWYF